MGGRGGSSGLSGGGTVYEKFDIPQNSTRKFDASRLEGSDKQREYAQNIIDDAFRSADAEIRRAVDAVKYYSSQSDINYKLLAGSIAKAKATTEIKNKIADMSDKTKAASSIIKNKLTIQNLMPSIRNNLEEKYRAEYEERFKKKIKK